jgi:hypothetical protein
MLCILNMKGLIDINKLELIGGSLPPKVLGFSY